MLRVVQEKCDPPKKLVSMSLLPYSQLTFDLHSQYFDHDDEWLADYSGATSEAC